MNKLSLFLFFQFFIAITSTIFSRPNAIVVGASSGIGKAVAEKLAGKYNVGIAARRTELLRDIKRGLDIKYLNQADAPQIYIKTIDVTKIKEMQENLAELILEMGGTLDLIVISVTAYSPEGTSEEDTIEVDLKGFLNVASFAIKIFKQQKHGHLIGISSVDAVKGNASCPVYSASKAFISTYLEGQKNYMSQKGFNDIIITDILPGWVDTEKVKFSEIPSTYLVINAETAADLICKAISEKRTQAFIPEVWKKVAQSLKEVPDSIYNSWWPWR